MGSSPAGESTTAANAQCLLISSSTSVLWLETPVNAPTARCWRAGAVFASGKVLGRVNGWSGFVVSFFERKSAGLGMVKAVGVLSDKAMLALFVMKSHCVGDAPIVTTWCVPHAHSTVV